MLQYFQKYILKEAFKKIDAYASIENKKCENHNLLQIDMSRIWWQLIQEIYYFS